MAEQEAGMYDLEVAPVLTSKDKLKNFIRSLPSKTFSIVQGFVLISALLVVLYLILITPHQVDGLSMFPTYQDKEYLIANKMIYKLSKPDRGDVVIFKFSETRDFIKRVIAVAGDQIYLSDGHYYINGVQLDESEYLAPTVYTEPGHFLVENSTITVQEGYVFVSGDNRPHSSDSRAFGPVEITKIKGKVMFIFLPVGNFRVISDPDYNL